MTSSFVPPRNPLVAGLVHVQAGESLSAICRRLGKPPAAYPELVAVNLHRALDTSGPIGSCAVLKGLREGDALFVPESWGSNLAGVSGNPGRVGDELVDLIETLYPYQAGGAVNPGQYDGLVETLAAWWRLKSPNQLPTSVNDLAPFAKPLLGFYETIGQYLPSSLLAKLPWGAVPWAFVGALANKGFAWWNVDADKVNKLLIARVKPGSVKHLPPVLDWSQATFDKTTLQAQKMDNTAIWGFLPKLRWDLFPETLISTQDYVAQPGGPSPTDWLMKRLEALFPAAANDVPDAAIEDLFPGGGGGLDFLSCGLGKVKLGGQCYGVAPPGATGCPPGTITYSGACIVNPCPAGQQPQVDPTTGITCLAGGTPGGGGLPGGASCPPGASPLGGSSCDCKPLGALFVYDPIRNECVNCGPNSVYNVNTGECSCLAGYVLPAQDTEGGGCVAQGGGAAPPVVQCGAGTKLVGGQCVPVEAPPVEKDDTTKKVVTGVGIVVGLLMVAYGLKTMKKK